MSTRLRSILIVVAVTLLVALSAIWWMYRSVLGSPFQISETVYVYVRPDDTAASVRRQLCEVGNARHLRGWNILCALRSYQPRTGRYAVSPGESMLGVYRKLLRGHQEPVRLTVPSVRGLHRLAGTLGSKLMMDSVEVAELLADTAYMSCYGYDAASVPSMFIPNTYEVYWDISVDDLMERLQREHDRFWAASERMDKAAALGLTPEEVYTLASIVDEETAVNDEKPDVAGLYINRLRRDMPLQADPTVKFAVGDETLRRITSQHLQVESPYNTYLHEGLPPGPIRIASIAGIDAVLNATKHNYIYMCAREDFSGRHNFASNYAQHQANARRYQQALNRRGIH